MSYCCKRIYFEIVARILWFAFYTQQFWKMVYSKVVKHEKQNIPIVVSSVATQLILTVV